VSRRPHPFWVGFWRGTMAPLELFCILLRAPLQLGLALLIGIPMFLFGMFAAAAVDLYRSISEWDDKYWG